jgi:hypothetical protein
MSDAAFRVGVEEHTMAGAQFRVYGVAKTVADCFKYRNRIGFDIAMEALREVMRKRAATPSEIMEFARLDKVESVISPYMAALL